MKADWSSVLISASVVEYGHLLNFLVYRAPIQEAQKSKLSESKYLSGRGHLISLIWIKGAHLIRSGIVRRLHIPLKKHDFISSPLCSRTGIGISSSEKGTDGVPQMVPTTKRLQELWGQKWVSALQKFKIE